MERVETTVRVRYFGDISDALVSSFTTLQMKRLLQIFIKDSAIFFRLMFLLYRAEDVMLDLIDEYPPIENFDLGEDPIQSSIDELDDYDLQYLLLKSFLDRPEFERLMMRDHMQNRVVLQPPTEREVSQEIDPNQDRQEDNSPDAGSPDARSPDLEEEGNIFGNYYDDDRLNTIFMTTTLHDETEEESNIFGNYYNEDDGINVPFTTTTLHGDIEGNIYLFNYVVDQEENELHTHFLNLL